MENKELIRLLKKTKKMSNKYLAKRIDKVDSFREQERINAKVYELFVSLLSNESKDELFRLNSIIILLCNRICDNSDWTVLEDYSFVDGDSRVARDKDGYNSINNTNKELSFVWDYGVILEVLNDVLNEREEFLLKDYSLVNEDDRELAQELITYLSNNTGNNKTYIKK